jgi:Hemerythrin HHE cation binding domain
VTPSPDSVSSDSRQRTGGSPPPYGEAGRDVGDGQCIVVDQPAAALCCGCRAGGMSSVVDIFRLLQRDHRELDSLLRRLEQPPDEADFDEAGRRYLLDRLVSVAARHEAAEEVTFWPHVRRRLPDGARLTDQALRDERDAKAVLDLLRFVRSEAELAGECGQLRTLIAKHAGFEEGTVFPRMRTHTGWLWARLAAMRFRAARRIGPTRPHPHGPDRPLSLMTIGAPAAVFDHLRDLGDRGRRHPTGFENPDHTDAVGVLTDLHAGIIQLLARIEAQPDPDDALVHDTIRELSVHDAIERQYLYPVVRRRLEDGPQRCERLVSEHGRVTELAADLDAYRFHDESRLSWLRELIAATRTLIEHEEAGVLPALAARMTHEELVDLGAMLESARTKAPSRPHRHAVATGAGARMSRWFVAPVDRARDALQGRRSA